MNHIIGDAGIRGRYLPTRLLDIPDNGLLNWADERILRENQRRENGGTPEGVHLPDDTFIDDVDVESLAWEILRQKQGMLLQNGMVLEIHPFTSDLILIPYHSYEEWKEDMEEFC